MEVEGVRRTVNRCHADKTLNSKVVAYVHDRDGKTKKLLAKIWPGKRELLDLNHAMKPFDRKLNKNQKLNRRKRSFGDSSYFFCTRRHQLPRRSSIGGIHFYIFRECIMAIWDILLSKEYPGQWCQLIRPGHVLTQPTKAKMKWSQSVRLYPG
jgi:hypothetical protein